MTEYERLATQLAVATLVVPAIGAIANVLALQLATIFERVRQRVLWIVFTHKRQFRVISSTVGLFLVVSAGLYRFSSRAGTVAIPVAKPARPKINQATRLRSARGVRFAQIPAGAAGEGCGMDDDECTGAELPYHTVTIAKPFRMSVTETTIGQYHECVKAGVCAEINSEMLASQEGADKLPKTWIDAQHAAIFCRWLGGDLPTEIEWEYAARGGRPNAKYPWGSSITPANARFRTAQASGVASVASFAPNGFGLYDMSGNVAEMCWGAKGDDGQRFIILRGGSYKSPPDRLRVSARTISDASSFGEAIGFRCVIRE